jgi:two-component system C4-dicarboxylate transport response regulator DctD
VPINCGAIPDAAADAELFGTAPEAGSLRRPQFAGRVAEAHRGALFLDEIDSSSAAFQSKLLRVLEEREFTSLGSSDARLVDLRVIAAAKADLQAAVDAGRFRQDLFYRLDVVRLHIPPLRERREDIMPLFAHFAAEGARRIGVRDYFVSDSVRQHLIEYAWPGNVRELRNFAFNVVLGLPAAAGQTPTAPHPAKALGERVDEFEEVAIREVLLATSGNVTESVARLGVPRKTLYAKFQRYGIDPNLYRQRSGETPHGRGSPV